MDLYFSTSKNFKNLFKNENYIYYAKTKCKKWIGRIFGGPKPRDNFF